MITENGWFAARPSGTEDVYKIYAESFHGPEHLAQIQGEARDVVSAALGGQAWRRSSAAGPRAAPPPERSCNAQARGGSIGVWAPNSSTTSG